MAEEEWGEQCSLTDSCALTGAAAFFAGISGAEIVANGPLWCYYYAVRFIEKSDPLIEKRFWGTQPDNNSVVFGTEECLTETLDNLKAQTKPTILLIENSCSVSLIGDDIAGIAAKTDLPCPVVCLDSGGMLGGFSAGYSAAALKFYESFPLAERAVVQKGRVNLLGACTSYFNGVNDLREIKRLLQMSGYTVGACPGAGSSLAEICNLTAGELNLVIHEELGLAQARYLKENYGIPYLSVGMPYGVQGTLRWLEAVNAVIPGNLAPAGKEAAQAEAWQRPRLNEMRSTWGELWFDSAVIAAPASAAVGIAAALRLEWADMDKLTVVIKDKPEILPQTDYIDELLVSENNLPAVNRALENLQGGLLLGSSNEKAYVQRKCSGDVLCFNLANPVNDEVLLNREPFAGLRGAGNMLQKLWNGKILLQSSKVFGRKTESEGGKQL